MLAKNASVIQMRTLLSRLMNVKLESIFGPSDNDELVSWLAAIAANARLPEDAELKALLAQYPLSHNLRVFAVSLYRELNSSNRMYELMIETLCLYPRSPIVLGLALQMLGKEQPSAATVRIRQMREEGLVLLQQALP